MVNPIIELYRRKQNNIQTIGTCVVLINSVPVFNSVSLEPGWNNNTVGKSCVPKDMYEVVLEWSEKYERLLWEIKGVPNRSEAKFHSLNYYFDSEGCPGLGFKFKDINHDGFLDIIKSVDTMKLFHKALSGYKKATLIIKGDSNIN